jgi:hypothetical protein
MGGVPAEVVECQTRSGSARGWLLCNAAQRSGLSRLAAGCRTADLATRRCGESENRFGGKDGVDARVWQEREAASEAAGAAHRQEEQRTGRRVYRTNARSCVVTRNRSPPPARRAVWGVAQWKSRSAHTIVVLAAINSEWRDGVVVRAPRWTMSRCSSDASFGEQSQSQSLGVTTDYARAPAVAPEVLPTQARELQVERRAGDPLPQKPNSSYLGEVSFCLGGLGSSNR